MSRQRFRPTEEQKAIIGHAGNAFIAACPGAGKTQVLVERARQELRSNSTGQGVAFLSFTNAAISELRSRLESEALLPVPPFPHYVGTFDTFIWQFFVAALGVPGYVSAPKLIPDMEERTIAPFPNVQELPLSCFEVAGKIIPDKARQYGFDPEAKPTLTGKYEEAALRTRQRFFAKGELSFTGVRAVVKAYIQNQVLSARLAAALAARFREIIVDEAQDCNPEDIEIINWLRSAGITTKIVCDPHQSIYEFRGGVTGELFGLRDSFAPCDQMNMTGNFRSNRSICKAIAAFRALGEQEATDQPLGPAAADDTPVFLLLYSGTTIPSSIGHQFRSLVAERNLEIAECPVVCSTKDGAFKAIGQPVTATTQHRTLRLAFAVSCFHAGVEVGVRKQAMEAVHRILLELGGNLGTKTYYQYIAESGLNAEEWRPKTLELLGALRYGVHSAPTPDAWLELARFRLSPYLGSNCGTIAQKLSKHVDLAAILTTVPSADFRAGTIHSVKGMQYPGVCVVMSTQTTKGIVDFLTTGEPSEQAEGARKLYVGASRAQRLLAIALPKSQGSRLAAHIEKTGANVKQIILA